MGFEGAKFRAAPGRPHSSYATYIRVLFFAHIPFVVNRAFNATPTERLQQRERNKLHF